MKFDLDTLMYEREKVINEQGNLFAEIKTNAKNPARTGELLCQVTDSAVRYNDLTIAVQHAIHTSETRVPFWKRLFRK